MSSGGRKRISYISQVTYQVQHQSQVNSTSIMKSTVLQNKNYIFLFYFLETKQKNERKKSEWMIGE